MKPLSWIFIFLGVLGLVSVRIFEDRIFYDPFLAFFHSISKNKPLPEIFWPKLILGHILRFSLNFIFSLVIVHFLFRRKDWTMQAAILILLVFAVTFPLYLYCIYSDFQIGLLFSFYIRRFVIQPLAVLIIIPLFFYRKHTLKGA